MKEPYGEGLANHADPESCGDAREGMAEALTGARAGRPLSRESLPLRSADAVPQGGRQHRGRRYRETPFGLRAVLEPEHARKLFTRNPGDPAFGLEVMASRPAV
jgi:hypothetical protein